MNRRPTFNERAWAIDVISEINRLASTGRRTIKWAGGEWGVSAGPNENVMFPDVLLFGDHARCAVLQGWELKMPDTPITDSELLKNALEKCRRLGLSSFLVWNGTDAVLYQVGDDDWEILNTWHCDEIKSRRDVQRNKSAWIRVLVSIIEELNEYFEQGFLSSEKPLPLQLNEVVATMLAEWTSRLALHLAKENRCSRSWRTEVSIWWRGVKAEHGITEEEDKFELLATEVLLHWMHRFLFAHYLRRYVADARGIDGWDEKTTITQAETWFAALSKKHDYAQILRPHVGAARLSPVVWRSLVVFNSFLRKVRLVDLDQHLFQETLQAVRQESQRKVAGQFCTPKALAALLSQLAVDDLTQEVLDPCCGTGMIAREVIALKKRAGSSAAEAIKTTWASDRYAMPLQFTQLALVSGDAPFETPHVFQHDATMLTPGQNVSFVNPQTGEKISERLPEFPCIVLNPPFVRFEDWMKAEASIKDIWRFIRIALEENIDSKSDYFVPIILHMWRLLTDNGRLGVIMPNAWLGATWGVAFRRILRRLFTIESVIISGKGRWFDNADIVTTLTILQKKEFDAAPQIQTAFAITRHPLAEWTDDVVEGMRDCVVDQTSSGNDAIQINRISQDDITSYETMGLSWISCFSELDWLSDISSSLILVSSLFKIGRGERRGWDKMFFPSAEEDIESEYIKPVLRSAASVKRLVAMPDGRAFCCSRTMDELEQRGDYGALNWIRRFQNGKNNKGVPLTVALARGGQHWYEMKPDSIAHIAVSMNPGNRLFFMRLSPPAFVNQRLIRFVAKNTAVDIELCHALLCTLMGNYFLEALGFGRGLGALDINATKLAKHMRMLNPEIISPSDRQVIIDKFEILKRRNVLHIEEELARKDRMAFEKAVFSSFGLQSIMPKVKKSFLDLYGLRIAVNC